MHSALNVWFILFSCVIAIVTVTVHSNNTRSSVSNQTPVKQNSAQTSDAIKSREATLGKKLDQLIAAVSFGQFGQAFPSCKEIYTNENKAYLLQMNSMKVPVYCHMTNDIGACGGGGWTLVMKIDGNENTFHYDSDLWKNKIVFNLPGGKTGFDTQETKLPTYWNTPFSKVCLGMKIGQQINFIVINKQANSLYSLIADGRYRATSLGRNTWKTLIGSQASLQLKCNKKGFNALGGSGDSKARIGLLGNQQNHCDSCNSRIGFGTGGNPYTSNTCGNSANPWDSPDNGGKNIKAMGYILVQ